MVQGLFKRADPHVVVSAQPNPSTPNPNAPTGPTRPDPRDPTNPTPLGQTHPFDPADQPKIDKMYGQLVRQMNNLSSVQRSQVAAITGKDFSNIKAETTESAFVPQVQSFLQNIVDDGKRVEALGKDGKTYLTEINDSTAALEKFRTDKGYTQDQIKTAIGSGTSGLLTSATKELANSTATLADTGKTYGDRLDGKASELLSAWDTSITNGAGEAWNGAGLRSGQVANLFGAITAADLKGYANSTPGATASELDQKAEFGHQHLTDLKARFDKYVDESATSCLRDDQQGANAQRIST